jgi:hypothetical protein
MTNIKLDNPLLAGNFAILLTLASWVYPRLAQ